MKTAQPIAAGTILVHAYTGESFEVLGITATCVTMLGSDMKTRQTPVDCMHMYMTKRRYNALKAKEEQDRRHAISSISAFYFNGVSA